MNNPKAFEVVSGLLGERLATMLFAELDSAKLAVYEKRTLKVERKPTASQPLTDGLRLLIIQDYLTTNMTQQQIAEKHNVNSGRVSETLRLISKNQLPPPEQLI